MYEQSLTGATVDARRRPVGVVGLITPWNFPAAIPAWKAAPALAYGNTVVMKLEQDAPLTDLHLARALQDTGLPGGVLNVVIGFGSQPGEPVVTPPAVRPISFTELVTVAMVFAAGDGGGQAGSARARPP